MATLWEGRLSGATTDALKALNDSLQIDKRLYREDISGSTAHVKTVSYTHLTLPTKRIV